MKKTLTEKLLSIFLAAVISLGAIPAMTLTGFAAEVELTFKLNSEGDGYIVSDCDEFAHGEVVIPSTYNGLPVTEIGDEAFKDCAAVEAVKIPSTVTKIGESAFTWCSKLVNVEFSEGLTSIGMSAFGYCSSLVKIDLPDTLKILDSLAFANCRELLFVNMPGSLEEIGSNVFAYCDELYSATIENGVKIIPDEAFYECTSLEIVSIPDSVKEIGSAAFMGCVLLDSVEIPGSVVRIADDAFECCMEDLIFKCKKYSAAYDYALDFGFAVKETGVADCFDYEFNGSVFGFDYEEPTYTLIRASKYYDYGDCILPKEHNGYSVSAIDYNAFEGCDTLTSIELSGISEIYGQAFLNCTALEKVTFGDDLYYIAPEAFLGCTKLYGVTIPEYASVYDYSFGYYLDEDSGEYEKYGDFVINGYTYSGAHDYAYLFGFTFNSIGETEPFVFVDYNYGEEDSYYTLSGCSYVYSIGELVIPAEYNGAPVKAIEYGAFENFDEMTAVKIEKGIEAINAYAFSYCDNLSEVIIPETVTAIDHSAFLDCPSLTSVTIPDSVSLIADYAFGYKLDNDTWKYVPVAFEFVINGYPDSAAEVYAEKNNIKFNAVGTKLINTETGASVAGKLADGTTLNVETVEEGENEIVYNITLTNNGVAVQPNGTVTVRLCVPSTFDGSECKVYRKEADGTYTDMKAVFDGANLIFTTDHFSEYIITEGNTEEIILYGDVNGDGALTPSDVVLLRRYFANYNSDTGESTITVYSGADVNGDGALTPSDVVLLRRYFANYNSDTGESTIVLGK